MVTVGINKRILFLWCSVFLPASLSAAIIVTNFHSDIIVKVNRSLEVRETLLINDEGTIEPHEIYRNIPVQMLTPQGIKTRVKLTVNRILVDGMPATFSVRNNGRYKRVRVESFGNSLRHGLHTIVFEYEIANQVRFFDQYDEITWNISGVNRDFTIQNASAKIIFPSGIDIISSNGYTGNYPGGACDCTGGPVQKSIWEGYITDPLYGAMGWGITIRFTKGFVLPVSQEEIQTMVRKRTRIFYAGVGGIFLVLLLYGTGLLLSGKYGINKRILPRSAPSDGCTADLCRYYYHNGYDSKNFTSLLIQMAVKGALSITKNDEKFTLKKAHILPANLNKTQSGVLTRIFNGAGTVELSAPGGGMAVAFRYHEKILRKKDHYARFRNNLPWTLPGLISSVALVFLLNAWIFIYNPETYDFTLSIGLATLSVIPLIAFVINNYFYASRAYRILTLTTIIIGLYFFFVSLSSLIVFLMKDTDLDWKLIPFYTSINLILILAGMVFAYGIKFPTGINKKRSDEADGLKQYLRAQDPEKLAMISRPAMTVRHFENLFPYAVGLDAEYNWSHKFEAIMNQAIGSGYPVTNWYNGNIVDFNASRFSNEIRYSFHAALLGCYFPDNH